jgi:hypothetical protein
MRHLKLFEGFDGGEYYQEVSGDDYTSNNIKMIEMSDRVKNQIELWFSDDPNNTIYYGMGMNVSCKLGFIYIYELEDEWFDVFLSGSGNTTFYKCDQLDGLKKLLEDLGII